MSATRCPQKRKKKCPAQDMAAKRNVRHNTNVSKKNVRYKICAQKLQKKMFAQDMSAKNAIINIRHKLCPQKTQKEMSATKYVHKKKCPL